MGSRTSFALMASIIFCLLLAACEGTTRDESAEPAASSEQGLQETVGAHFSALEARDLDALLPTVTSADSLVLILPSGTTTYTRDEYLAFHRAWFSDSTWTMSFQQLSSTIRDDVAILLFRTTYTDGTGSRPGLVSLTFARENGAWRLIFDQNTRLPDA